MSPLRLRRPDPRSETPGGEVPEKRFEGSIRLGVLGTPTHSTDRSGDTQWVQRVPELFSTPRDG